MADRTDSHKLFSNLHTYITHTTVHTQWKLMIQGCPLTITSSLWYELTACTYTYTHKDKHIHKHMCNIKFTSLTNCKGAFSDNIHNPGKHHYHPFVHYFPSSQTAILCLLLSPGPWQLTFPLLALDNCMLLVPQTNGVRDSVDGLTFEGQELPEMRGGEMAMSGQNSQRITTLKLSI